MPYTPENNPYIPGDPFSYDLKWIVDKLKEAIALYAPLAADFQELHDYVMDYFDNLDLTAEVHDELNAMAADGRLEAVIEPLFDAYKADINSIMALQNNNIAVLTARVDAIASLPSGSTAGDAELQDIRIGANAFTYTDAGTAVRNQVSNLTAGEKVLNDKVNVITGYLTVNATFPYIDVPINGKNGEWIAMRFLSFTGNVNNLVRWYAFNPATNTTIKTPLSQTARDSFKLTTDTAVIRFIFQITAAEAPIQVSFELYKFTDPAEITNLLYGQIYEYEITAAAGVAINKNHIPFYAEQGDVIKLEIEDSSGVLSDDYVGIIGYTNAGGQVGNVIRMHKPFTAGYGIVSTPFDPDSLIFFVNAAYVSNAGTIKLKYQNITKAGIETPRKRYSSVSILGDSYSAYKGTTDPDTNRYWYPTNDANAQGYGSGNNVTDLSYMWYYILGDESELYIKSNASYSGSTICYDSYGTGTSDGKATSFIQRADDAENASLTIIYGGANDYWAGAAVGTPKYSGWTESDLCTFAPALAYLIDYLKHNHLGTDILFVENSILSAEYKTAIETVCAHYKVPVLKPENVGLTYNHPNILGMRRIADSVRAWLRNNITYPYYE